MRKFNKILIFSFVGIIVISSVWFNFFFISKNILNFEKNLFDAGKESDVIIVFNPGGWGTVSLEEAKDFNPIVNEIKKSLEEKNYKVSIVEYYRTKENFLGKLGSLREIISNFSKSSKIFAEKIELFINNYPERKIVMAGLSNGASFVDSTMENLEKKIDGVVSIELGAPFWGENIQRENTLKLKNEEDILARGDIGKLFISLVKAPFIWSYNNLKGEKTSFSEAMMITGHEYYWPEVEQEIASFVKEKF